MPSSAKIYRYAGFFFGAVLLSYACAAPKLFPYVTEGYADFSNFYGAGQILHRGLGNRLYDPALQAEVQREFSHAAVVLHRALLYLRPPFQALIFLPLTYLSYIRAYQVWVVLSGVLVWATARFLRPRIPELQTLPWSVYYLAYFSFWPVAYGLVLGQDAALMLLLVGLFVVALREGKDFRAGCFLGLALIKFQLVLPLVFILFVKRQFRVLGGFAVVAGGLACVSVWVVGWDGLVGYPGYLQRMNHAGAAVAIFPGMMPSFRGLVEGWTNPAHSSSILDVLTGMVSLAVLIWAARQWDISSPRTSKIYLAGVSMALLAGLLAGYHMFSYDLSLLCPVLLLASASGLKDVELDAVSRKLLLLGAAGLLFAPLYLLLIWKGRLNLMAFFLVVLLWGYSRAIKDWKFQQARFRT